ncbi:MAG: PDZ domain-containing protein [Verrucomicrobia bacterium]|nr:PDZ domain-containing protein [Verrucomicrobiota bacterium]
MNRQLAIALLLCGFAVPEAGAAQSPDKGVVEMSPYKVVSRGWNVYWSLSFPVLGRLTEVFFREVDAGSLAGNAGIKEGDRLLRVNGKAVKGMRESEMERLLWPAKPSTLVLHVQAAGAPEIRTVELQLPETPGPKAEGAR